MFDLQVFVVTYLHEANQTVFQEAESSAANLQLKLTIKTTKKKPNKDGSKLKTDFQKPPNF